ncbi:hypothetical protein [Acidisoma silvae]|uniref:Uncharacterized protein n=1 Tax=Acidisoma silvae TaxID=2802396 RepID=A0A963YQA7_9PROT|nr:hypothetical protein [Acidisoma silvae]MCB8874689.1 hypothetical protein [Acidisoma silvae]
MDDKAPLLTALALLVLTQVWAGCILRGLFADGCYYAARLWLQQGFVVIEPSRLTAQILVQAPVVLGMRLGATSPQAVALLFSLSTNLTPALLTGLAVLALPRDRLAYALVPVFVFLTGAMATAFASVADGPCAAAYCCLLFLLVAIAPLTPARLSLILFLSAGCLRLYESTVVIGPLLILACVSRARKTTGCARWILCIAALCLAIGSLHAAYDILHPRVPANRASFMRDLANLHWLWTAGAAHIPAIAGMLAFACLRLGMLPARYQIHSRIGVIVLFAALAMAAVALPAAPISAFAGRGNACLVAAGLFGFVLATRNRSWQAGTKPRFAVMTATLLAVTVTIGNIRADLDWMRYRTALHTVLRQSDGLIAFPAAGRTTILGRDSWPWSSPIMSLLLAPEGEVRSILLNPTGSGPQPVDPAPLGPLLPLSARAALIAAFQH